MLQIGCHQFECRNLIAMVSILGSNNDFDGHYEKREVNKEIKAIKKDNRENEREREREREELFSTIFVMVKNKIEI